MVAELDKAQQTSVDPPDGPDLLIASYQRPSGRGQAKILIEPNILKYALELRPISELAKIFRCSARTVRRRALELGLVDPCPPVQSRRINEDGSDSVEYTSYIPNMADLTDDQIDEILHDILEMFPSFGRQMIISQFRVYGYRLSRARVRDSYLRVIGPPPEFGGHRIERRVYRVAGPNALVHHDGWHGMCIYSILMPTWSNLLLIIK
jgi:hypothetical protein